MSEPTAPDRVRQPERAPEGFTARPIRCRVWYRGAMYYRFELGQDEAGHLYVAQLSGEWTFSPESDRCTVMLSTGLHDADGQEVFDGDLIAVSSFDPKVGTVFYDDHFGVWRLRGIGRALTLNEFVGPDSPGSCRVVGNVFEGVQETA